MYQLNNTDCFYSLGSNGGGKVVEDEVHLLHGLDLQHEAGNLTPPHLHHTCYTALKDRVYQLAQYKHQTPIRVFNPRAMALKVVGKSTMPDVTALACWHMTSI